MAFDLGDFGRAVAAVATGGLSEVAIQTTQAAAGAASAAAGAAGNFLGGALGGHPGTGVHGGGAPGLGAACAGPGGAPVGASLNTCCRFQLHDQLLLDTQTGAVWKYDGQRNALVPVERDTDPFRKALEAAGLLHAKGALDDLFGKMTRTEQTTYRDVFDALHRSTAERTRTLLASVQSTVVEDGEKRPPKKPR